MSDLVNRNDLIMLMEKRADYDAQPRACRRMISAVRNFPTCRAVPADVFLELLSEYTNVPAEVARWKQKAGI